MVAMFGLEDDENIGLLNKVSQVMGSHLNVSKKNISQTLEERKPIPENNASFFKGGCSTPLGGASRNDVLFLKDLSKIELDRSGTGNLMSTDRAGVFGDKEPRVLKGGTESRPAGVTEEQESNGQSASRTPDQQKEDYKHKLNEAFHNSDFTNMSQNLQMYQLHQAKLQNSKRKKSAQSKENVSQDVRPKAPVLTHTQMRRLTPAEREELLGNRDFNFELGQEFLESRYVAYQSKDLKHSLRNAKQIERSLMQLKLDDSDASRAPLRLTPESGSGSDTGIRQKNFQLPSFPSRSKGPLLQASKNKFSNSTNTVSEQTSQRDTNDISEFVMDSRFEHDRNDELALIEFSSGSQLKAGRDGRVISYRANPRMHMYRSIHSDEVSQIRLENRNRMAHRETRNPLMQFFRMILIKFGCSDH